MLKGRGGPAADVFTLQYTAIQITLKGREGPAAVFTSQYTAIQTTLGPRNVRASVSIANSALVSTYLIVSNQCDLCDVKSNAGAPAALCLMRQRCGHIVYLGGDPSG